MSPEAAESSDPQPPPTLEYARPGAISRPRWFARPLTPGVAAVIWALSSLLLSIADGRMFYPHILIGLFVCGVAEVVGWHSGWFWRSQAFLSLVMLAIGIELFIAPWRVWGFRTTYWTTYNQTYLYNYDASLRVAWVPLTAIGWFIATSIGARLSRRRGNP